MTEPTPLSTTEALEALVHQFSEPLAFFRELVQNAIDAGSAEIDISIAYQDSVLEIRIDDYGDGMDRQIIDARLTRLFSSSKEGDQTKIGRFGIGFVSVFALDPDAVILDTARGGEAWRVLFRKDRTFERIALPAPVDGTKIRILKKSDRALYEEVLRRAPELIAHYCRHTEAEIRFHGKPVNQPFDLDTPCKIAQREDGTAIVVGYAAEAAVGGYYNRGLTLLEQPLPEQLYSFKINSRHLEHTLTRDNVLRDEGYDGLMKRVRELGENALPLVLFERLEEITLRATPAGGADEHALHGFAARQIAAWGGPGKGLWKEIAKRRIARTLGGEALSLQTLAKRASDGDLYTAVAANAITEALAARGTPCVACESASRLPELLSVLGGKALDAGSAFCLPEPLRADVHAGYRALAGALQRLVQGSGAGVHAVRFGHYGYPGSGVAQRIAVLQAAFGELTDRTSACRSVFETSGEKLELVVNADHACLPRLLVLAEREPELAAHLTCKLLLIGPDLTPQRDSQLALLALEARWRRSKN